MNHLFIIVVIRMLGGITIVLLGVWQTLRS